MAHYWFCKNIGVPVNLIVDYHRVQTYIRVNIFCDQAGTILMILEKGNPWANRAELYIGFLKKAVYKQVHALHSQIVLWDYVIERLSLIHSTIPCPLFQNNGLTPHKVILGASVDISNICVYGWYEWT